ncbi:hypothetical protein SAMN04487996_12575 [Dyadobacter soli]|uniref:Uncharacterized protein n=1 Tax=Dyadobacter soli TaxID=659014 RepID=A0A1G7Y7G5_9BACT|nr:hypothetical protein [Dyadobacter soli]SDG92263.1 hypothetical protein SAMN04487996_12575 [Dyadobacter soli]
MKTSEDKLNEALRDVLKRKFDDYEEQPSPTALDRIRARIKPPRTGRYWWFTGGLVLLTVSGILLSRYGRQIQASLAVSEKAHSFTVEKAKAARPANANPTVNSVKETSAYSAKALSFKTKVKSSVLPSGSTFKEDFVEDLGNKPAAETHQPHSANVPGATVNRVEKVASVNGEQMAEVHPGSGTIVPEIERAFNETEGALASKIAVDSAAMNAMSLEELAGMPLKEAQIPLRLRGVVAPAYKPAKVIVTNPARIAWLFNASALHSYQILTVPSSAAKDFQNFSFPSLFTARSVGYKFSGGVERKGIQLQLHFSSFRQIYSYEIANNNYLVTPDDKGQYHTVRQGDRMEENRRFSMLGIGVTKQVRWGHSPVSRFFAAFGAEYSHDLNSSQGLGWLSLGLGKQFAVSRNTAFSIGPFAEFSPVKVKGIANPFYYQPYRVGISAGLRFVRP